MLVYRLLNPLGFAAICMTIKNLDGQQYILPEVHEGLELASKSSSLPSVFHSKWCFDRPEALLPAQSQCILNATTSPSFARRCTRSTILATMNRMAPLAAMAVLLVHGALAQPADHELLPDFRALVQFHFRERIPNAPPGEKNVTAPDVERQDLPPARLLPRKRRRVIEGRVPDLPFVFYLRLTHPNPPGPPLLEVNVVNPQTNQSINGFPARKDLTDTVDFEIPLSEAQTRRARHALGDDPLAFITYVNLVVKLDTSE
jgi:hypothetical protein